MKGQLHILDRTGHTTLSWDAETENTKPDNGPLAQSHVEAEFDRLVGQGHLAFGTTEGGENIQLKKFDPTMPKVTLTPQFVGG